MDSNELKKVGLKATLPRLRILEILERSEQRHLSAEDIYKALLDAGEDVGLATIYRVLTQFVVAGIATRRNFAGHAGHASHHAVYEIARGTHHDHMVCLKTGQVIEFVDEEIERRQQEIVAQHGFQLEDHAMVLYVRPKDDAEEE